MVARVRSYTCPFITTNQAIKALRRLDQAIKGCIDSVECGTVEWNSGTVEWWNSGMVGWSIDDPVPSTAVFMALTSVRN